MWLETASNGFVRFESITRFEPRGVTGGFVISFYVTTYESDLVGTYPTLAEAKQAIRDIVLAEYPSASII